MKKSHPDDPLYSKKLRTTYFTSIMNLAALLVVIGLLGLFTIHTAKLTKQLRETLNFSVILRDEAPLDKILEFKQQIEKTNFVHNAKYISKEEAAKDFTAELGEDFVKFLGYNPLPPSIEIQINATHFNLDSVPKYAQEFRSNPIVKEVSYNLPLIATVNQTTQKVSLVLSGLGVVLLITAILLINNTIWLSVYSRRHTIRSMQLIGATNAFIRRPFMRRSMLHGLYASIVAIAILIGVLYFSWRAVPELESLRDYKLFGITFAGLLIFGVLLSASCTYFSLRRLIRTKTDRLYTA